MSGKRSRDKGARFEREVANILAERYSLPFARGVLQFRGGGAEVPDVCLQDIDGAREANPHLSQLHLECKHHKKTSISAAWRQAVADCKLSGKTPVCVTKSDREPILVTMKLDDFLDILDVWHKDKISNG
jgi:hypothetical protein